MLLSRALAIATVIDLFCVEETLGTNGKPVERLVDSRGRKTDVSDPCHEESMPSIDRPLGGTALHYRLGDRHRSDLIDADLLSKAGRSARTLVKDGPLRVTLVQLGAGGALASHRAEGPITVHTLSGEVLFRAGSDEWRLEAGDLLSLGAGVEHSVESASGGVFLLTVATVPER